MSLCTSHYSNVYISNLFILNVYENLENYSMYCEFSVSIMNTTTNNKTFTGNLHSLKTFLYLLRWDEPQLPSTGKPQGSL